MSDWIQKAEKDAADRVRAVMAKPMPLERHDIGSCDLETGEPICFDPWQLFPSVYGSYSSEFDELGIDVLTDLATGGFERKDLAAEIFREMLCVADLCDYGTSPRVCFPTGPFRELLPELIEKWKLYREVIWS